MVFLVIKLIKVYFCSEKLFYLNMKELIEKINVAVEAFKTDAELQTEKGNKAAGTRARKASLELEKLFKEFRKTSVEASKA
jgi:hypothetical protein